MNRKLLLAVCVLAAAGLAACGGSGGDGPGITFVRGVNAVPDSPPLEGALTDYVVAPSVTYPRATNFSVESFEDNSTRRTLVVRPVLPQNEKGDPVLEQEVTLVRDTEATLVLYGSLDAMRVLPVETPRRLRPLDRLYIQFAHVAESIGTVDIYATAPDTELSSTAPLFTLAAENYTDSVEVPFDDLRIRMTREGTLDVVFDSGTIDFEDDPNRDDGEELVLSIIDTRTPGASPVKLLGATHTGGSIIFSDENGLAGLRVVHAAQGTGPFDVVAGDDFASPLATDLSYTQAGTMAAAPRGTVNLNFTVPGSTTEFVFEEQVTLTADSDHTLWLLGEPDSLAALTVEADRRSIATEARLRLVHVAPDGDFFSLYLGEAAANPPDEEDLEFVDTRFGQATGYRAFNPGDYVLTLTERFYTTAEDREDAEETVVIGPLDLALAGGDVITLLILPPETPGGPEVLQIYDDLDL